MLKVGELEEYLAKREEGSLDTKLDQCDVSDDATEFRVKVGFDDTKAFKLDETANAALTKFLKIPTRFYEDLTPDFRATLMRYKLDRHKDVNVVLESLKGEIVAAHEPFQTMIPLPRVAEVITEVMSNDDTVRRFSLNDRRFHLDVTTNKHQQVSPLADAEVGDITEGGLRMLAYPFQSRRPSIGAYLERLVCTNGMCEEERFGTVELKGRTVDEVIQSMEEAAQSVLGSLDQKLVDYAATRQMEVPGSPQAFAAQLAREAKVSRQVLDAVLDIINQLPSPITIWDVNQAFTSVANQMETYSVMVKLQSLGGALAFHAEKMVERCGTCERLL